MDVREEQIENWKEYYKLIKIMNEDKKGREKKKKVEVKK